MRKPKPKPASPSGKAKGASRGGQRRKAEPPINLTPDMLDACIKRARKLAKDRELLEADIYEKIIIDREVLNHIALNPTNARTAGSITLRAMEQRRKIDELLVKVDQPAEGGKHGGANALLEEAVGARPKSRQRAR